jgi:hypothetical protein
MLLIVLNVLNLLKIRGEVSLRIGMLLLQVLSVIAIVGVWKMKKSAGIMFTIILLVNSLLLLTQKEILESALDRETVAMIIIGFFLIYFIAALLVLHHLVINNPKDDTSQVRQKQIGLLIGIVGAILIFVAQTKDFVYEVKWNDGFVTGSDRHYDEGKKKIVLYSGIFMLIGGSIFFALSMNPKNKISNTKDETNTQQIQHDSSNVMTQIEKLSVLKDKGILTEDEFNDKKKQLLDKL